ncbi:hypothetical protein Hanom_Chr11g00985371 [Helianthus anomalus]
MVFLLMRDLIYIKVFLSSEGSCGIWVSFGKKLKDKQIEEWKGYASFFLEYRLT